MLKAYDDIFGNEDTNSNEITEIPISKLKASVLNRFRNYDKEKEAEVTESIRRNGVLNPIQVRKLDNETFEIIAGHNRTNCAEAAGLKTVPAFIKEMTDDEAVIIMVDTNLQREKIFPSDRALAYRDKYVALKNITKKGELTDEYLQSAFGVSGRQVRRYLKISELHSAVLGLIDNNLITMEVALEMSDVSKSIQHIIYELISEKKIKIKKSHIKKIKDRNSINISKDEILDVINEVKTNKKMKLDIDERYEKYFSNLTKEQVEEKIFEALDMMSKRS